MKTQTKIKLIAFVALIGGILMAAHFFRFPEGASVEDVRDYLLAKGIWAPVIFYLLYLATSIIIFPSVLLSMTSGLLWGPWLGTFYTVTAATLAAVIPFFLAKFFGQELINKIFKGAKLTICNRIQNRNGFITLMFLRLIPIFPMKVVSYGAGLCGFHFRHYLPATLMGMIPASLAFNILVDSLGKPLDAERIILIAVTVLVVLGVLVIYKRTQRDREHG